MSQWVKLFVLCPSSFVMLQSIQVVSFLFIFVLYVLFSILCVLWYILFLLMYITVLIFCVDHCHWVETQLQEINIILYRIKWIWQAVLELNHANRRIDRIWLTHVQLMHNVRGGGGGGEEEIITPGTKPHSLDQALQSQEHLVTACCTVGCSCCAPLKYNYKMSLLSQPKQRLLSGWSHTGRQNI